MMKYTEMTARQRQAEYDAVLTDYEKQKALGLKLNMARGKPSTEQLDMVMDMCSVLVKPEDFVSDGIDSPQLWKCGWSACCQGPLCRYSRVQAGAVLRGRQRQSAAHV
ncbi:MAG: hypothetical protein ACLUNQ_07320 [Oscillospiraceae bacterium]